MTSGNNPFELRHGGHHTLSAFEGLRGIAVLLVFFVHDVELTLPWLSALPSFASSLLVLKDIGQTGVDLFFILSGVLIYGSLIRKTPQPLAYAARRIERIYPTFLAVFALYVLVCLVMPSVSKIDWQDPNVGLYLVQNLLLLPGIFPIDPLITMAWSLSYEMFFYIVIPLIIALFQMRRMHPHVRKAIFICIGIVCSFLPDANPFQRMALFCAGVVVADLHAPQKAAWRWLGLVALVASPLLGVAVASMPMPAPIITSMGMRYAILSLMYGTAVWVCLHNVGVTARMMQWSPLRWLGNMSYSFYLIHGLALQACLMVLGKTALAQAGVVGWFVQVPIALMAALVASATIYLAVERPLSLVPASRGKGLASLFRSDKATS